MTEDELLRAVLDLARVQQWLVAHFRPALTRHGYRTPVQADGAGFPDVVLLREGRLVVAELKSDSGSLKPQQQTWLAAFQRAGADAFVWRPRDWPEIVATLARPRTGSEAMSDSPHTTGRSGSATGTSSRSGSTAA